MQRVYRYARNFSFGRTHTIHKNPKIATRHQIGVTTRGHMHMRRITASSKQLFSKPNNVNVSTQHMDVFIAYAGLRVKDREQTWMIVGGAGDREFVVR